MGHYVQVHLVNGDKPIFKCTKCIKTSQGYLFECKDGNRTFLTKEVESIDDPFELPNGFIIDRNKRY